MKIELKVIDKSIYNQMDSEVIFTIDNPKCYGILTNGDYSFKFGWQSEIVKPKVFEITENIYSIGIDLDFAIADFISKKILLKVTLDYFFYDTVINNGFIYVISELEIIKISQKSFLIIDKFVLTDFFKEITFKEELTEIITVGGNIMTFSSVGNG